VKGEVPKVCAEKVSELFRCLRPAVEWLVGFAASREKEHVIVDFLNINVAKDFLRKARQRKRVLTPVFANFGGQRGQVAFNERDTQRGDLTAPLAAEY
jgi:hypothetical protein